VAALGGGGISSSSFTVTPVIVDANEVHGMLIDLRFLAFCFFRNWLLTDTVSFWFPLLRRANILSVKN